MSDHKFVRKRCPTCQRPLPRTRVRVAVDGMGSVYRWTYTLDGVTYTGSGITPADALRQGQGALRRHRYALRAGAP